jgi:hypothetical protein
MTTATNPGYMANVVRFSAAASTTFHPNRFYPRSSDSAPSTHISVPLM